MRMPTLQPRHRVYVSRSHYPADLPPLQPRLIISRHLQPHTNDQPPHATSYQSSAATATSYTSEPPPYGKLSLDSCHWRV
ncbi:hypothetical protein Tco_0414800 [Tanacetum coccineum]